LFSSAYTLLILGDALSSFYQGLAILSLPATPLGAPNAVGPADLSGFSSANGAGKFTRHYFAFYFSHKI